MFHPTDDLRIESLRPLIPPAILMEEIPLPESANTTVWEARRAIRACFDNADTRLLAVVGPCSIHEVTAAREYGRRLLELGKTVSDVLIVVMRVYFEKPRTTVGWKGLINDPRLDGSFRVNEGLRLARSLLVDLNSIGLPVGCEFLDTITPQYIADCVAWGAIGARTTESQVHRELASGLSMPVGFKNGTGGDIQIAIDAIETARFPHTFLSVTKQGLSAIVETRGNDACHLILRGSKQGPNCSPEHLADAAQKLKQRGLPQKILVDCSHGNSRKDPARQMETALGIARLHAVGKDPVLGVMLESNLLPGRQDLIPGQAPESGRSVTDACLGWDETARTLEEMAAILRAKN